jgi:enoyl-CoA hydratase/carnithine racemase
MADEVLTERRDRVLLITLNRPESRNAINTELAEGLVRAIDELDGDDGLTVGVLTGAGSGFCSGMDLKAFAAGQPPKGFMSFLENGSSKPLIAAVERFAVAGGLEVALTCDLLVAAGGARLGIPEVSVGLFAAGGGLLRLPDRLPYGVAMEMALTGEPITAEQAYEHGLVSRLAEPGHAVDEALALAQRIAKNAPLAVRASKRLVRDGRGRSEAEFWDLQRPHVAPVFRSDDAKEGPRAFAEKRAPAWSGR